MIDRVLNVLTQKASPLLDDADDESHVVGGIGGGGCSLLPFYDPTALAATVYTRSVYDAQLIVHERERDDPLEITELELAIAMRSIRELRDSFASVVCEDLPKGLALATEKAKAKYIANEEYFVCSGEGLGVGLGLDVDVDVEIQSNESSSPVVVVVPPPADDDAAIIAADKDSIVIVDVIQQELQQQQQLQQQNNNKKQLRGEGGGSNNNNNNNNNNKLQLFQKQLNASLAEKNQKHIQHQSRLLEQQRQLKHRSFLSSRQHSRRAGGGRLSGDGRTTTTQP